MNTRIMQVKEFNRLMRLQENYMYIMTLGNGSMVDKPRVNGWVVFQSPKLGDSQDFAKLLPNYQQAKIEQELRV